MSPQKEAGRLTTTPLCSMLNNVKGRSLNLTGGQSVNILKPLKDTALKLLQIYVSEVI
jgi:hypothetical protein